MFVYQTDGDSDHPLPNWRCIKVWLMSDLREIAGKWHTGSSHKQRQSCVDIVDIDYNRNAEQRYKWAKPKAKQREQKNPKIKKRKKKPTKRVAAGVGKKKKSRPRKRTALRRS